MDESLVWITGAASGVGRHLVAAFLRRGYSVLASDVNAEGLRRAAAEDQWPATGLRLAPFDVTDAASWPRVWAEYAGGASLGILLNVAGYLKPGYLSTVSDEDIDRHIDVNVKGLIYGSRLAAQTMQSQGSGHIINFASLAGITPTPGIPLYGCSKFAVRGLSLSLALELADSGIAVTVVCPDAIQTPMLDLQLDYDEAALTFSGSSSLSVADIETAIFEQVLPGRPMELVLPRARGLLAKGFSLVPGAGRRLLNHFRRRGRARQQMLAGRREGRRQ